MQYHVFFDENHNRADRESSTNIHINARPLTLGQPPPGWKMLKILKNISKSFCSLAVPLIKPTYFLNVWTIPARFKRARLNRKFRSGKKMLLRKCSKNGHGIFSTSLLKPEHLDLNFDNLILALGTVRRSLRWYPFKFSHQKSRP